MRKQAELLKRVAELSSDKELRAGRWIRYEKYGLATASDGTRCVRALRHGAKREGQEYHPLDKHPDLFLRFARLADDGGLDYELDTANTAAVALSWSGEYGVLGLTPSRSRGSWWGDPRGGTGDTVAAFTFEAWVANSALRLYEAATDLRGVNVEAIAELASERYRPRIEGDAKGAREWAVSQAVRNVQAGLGQHTFPQLYQRKADDRLIEGHDFRNLLGAIYLQAMWLLLSDNPGRCRNPKCRRIIAFEQPEQYSDLSVINDRSGGYRPRTDREYCDNNKKCANAHYYERVTKPLRRAKQARRKAS